MFLPPANEVWGKVMFLQVSVILSTEAACVVARVACMVAGGHAWLPGGVHGCWGGMHG